ncbi:intercellular adhesion molecule 3-like isoform X2 [Rhineura floridana]|uniref:intercellular adhesion molecule 3-like isoform X2 n=1 Tax=Rhineura floridana TaxID=261503 RepID=UPI002AC7E9CB|nr:intercellular adhesion molecule 3-like isoform X2 [Rhineura floridana]
MAAVMRFWKLCVVFLWCAMSLPAFSRAQEEDFMRIWPENPVVPFGGFIVLNFSANCENIAVETSLSKVPAGDGPSWKAFNFTSVTHWEPQILCHADCEKGKAKFQTVVITVYRAPKRVELDPLPTMEVGEEYNVTCRVFNVAPIRNLTVTLCKGNEELHKKTFEDHNNPEASDVVVTHSITAQQDNHREEITCHAALDMRPEGPLFEKASPDKSYSQSRAVYPPEQVIVELQKSSTGQSWHYDLKCHVIRVAPLSNLTVTFFKGTERLISRKLWNYTKAERANVTVIHPIVLQPGDYGKEATCHVTLDVSPHKEPFTATSHKLELKAAVSSFLNFTNHHSC